MNASIINGLGLSKIEMTIQFKDTVYFSVLG